VPFVHLQLRWFSCAWLRKHSSSLTTHASSAPHCTLVLGAHVYQSGRRNALPSVGRTPGRDAPVLQEAAPPCYPPGQLKPKLKMSRPRKRGPYATKACRPEHNAKSLEASVAHVIEDSSGNVAFPGSSLGFCLPACRLSVHDDISRATVARAHAEEHTRSICTNEIEWVNSAKSNQLGE